jgi:hypothetical protein
VWEVVVEDALGVGRGDCYDGVLWVGGLVRVGAQCSVVHVISILSEYFWWYYNKVSSNSLLLQ